MSGFPHHQIQPGHAAGSRYLKRFRRCRLVLAAAVSGFATILQAFPPAPFYSIYGDARDQFGILIPAGSASVVLYADGRETMRESLTSVPGADYNYQLRIRLDMLRDASAAYSSQSLVTGKQYTLGIESGGKVYYPIEMATPPAVGKAADRRRLDLTLGVDSDGDGLPDAWEESQLYQAGIQPGAGGWDLSRIDRDGDLDRDGVRNFAEYIAGTYAGDAGSSISLQIREKQADSVRLEFYAFYGKSYVIQSSPDLKRWTDIPFSLEAPAAGTAPVTQASLLSPATGVRSVYASTPAESVITYYRLVIR